MSRAFFLFAGSSGQMSVKFGRVVGYGAHFGRELRLRGGVGQALRSFSRALGARPNEGSQTRQHPGSCLADGLRQARGTTMDSLNGRGGPHIVDSLWVGSGLTRSGSIGVNPRPLQHFPFDPAHAPSWGRPCRSSVQPAGRFPSAAVSPGGWGIWCVHGGPSLLHPYDRVPAQYAAPPTVSHCRHELPGCRGDRQRSSVRYTRLSRKGARAAAVRGLDLLALG